MTEPTPEPQLPPAAEGAPASPATSQPQPEKLTERPHPLTPFIRGWVVLLALVIAFGRDYLPTGGEERPLPPLQFLLAALGVVVVAAAVAGYVSWRFTRFVIDAEELRVDTGAVFRRSTRIAFDKVQSIDVVQPFAARLFGLAELQIDVGSQERAKLRYLQLGRAYALRDYLLTRARGYHGIDAGEASATSVLADLNSEDEVLVQVPPQTLLLAAVTSHEFWGIIASAVVAVLASYVFEQFWLILAIGIPTLSALVGFIGRRVTGQFNYTLSRRPHGLRVSRGLTSLTSQSLPPRRVQALQLSQSPIWRRLGLYRVDIEVIGWGQVTENEDKAGVSTILLPAGSIEQVRVAVRAIWPRVDFEAIQLRGAPSRARWVHPFSQPFLRWGHDDQVVVSRHGWLVRRWQIVPHARTQSVRTVQGPVSRKLRLADLEFHTAGMQISAHASGLDADHVLERQAELLALVHRLPELDVSEPSPSPDLSEPRRAVAPPASADSADQGAEGPDALRADQADATISSTE